MDSLPSLSLPAASPATGVEMLRKALETEKVLAASLVSQLDPARSPHPASRRLDVFA